MATRKHPSADCGKVSSKTIRLRPQNHLTEFERKYAKRLREEGIDFDEIASRLKRDVHDVEKSLATLRTKRVAPSRYTANISEAAHQKLEAMKMPDEAVWETMNRLLGV